MDLRGDAVFCSGSEDLVRVLHSEESRVAEHVHEVGETFFGYPWQHFVAYEIDIFRLASFIGATDSVRAKEIGLDSDRCSLLDAAYHPQHLELIFDSKSVSALDLYRSGTHGHDFAHADHGLLVELVLGGRVQQVGGIEDSAAACGYLLVREACDLVAELAVAAAGIYDMRMRVAESRHHEAALGIDVLDACTIVILSVLPVILSVSEGSFHTLLVSIAGNDPVLDHEVCIPDTLHMIHLSSFQLSDICRQYPCQSSDIVYDSLHFNKCVIRTSKIHYFH